MVAHSRDCYPNEACGLIAAERVGDQLEFRELFCLTNADASPVSYTIDPTEHFRSLQHAELNDWELVGAFHSHPHGAGFPSETDISKAADPDWLWFVIGLNEAGSSKSGSPDIGGFWIRDGAAIRAYPRAQ